MKISEILDLINRNFSPDDEVDCNIDISNYQGKMNSLEIIYESGNRKTIQTYERLDD